MVSRISAYGHRIYTVKKHAIIPIFIPHLGCPHKCVFCNQSLITARKAPVSESDVRTVIDTYLSTLGALNASEIEIAFYGGSFTGIPVALRTEYLKIAKSYIDAGRAGGIHLSTRPDYISEEILDNLAVYGVKCIELGVQSFDDRVLSAAKRGHDADTVRRSSQMIKEYGFNLGIQLMIGLPCDSYESCVYSAEETVRLAPELVRLYPTLVIDNTELYDMYVCGSYISLTQDEAVTTTAAMYRILRGAGITIMRVGLKSTDIISSGTMSRINGGTYHPAFRQLVEGRIAYEDISAMLPPPQRRENPLKVDVFSSPSWFSCMIGNGQVNKKRFAAERPDLSIKYMTDKNLPPGQFIVTLKKQ